MRIARVGGGVAQRGGCFRWFWVWHFEWMGVECFVEMIDLLGMDVLRFRGYHLCVTHTTRCQLFADRLVGRRDDLRIDPPALGDTTICLTTPSFQLHSSSTPMARRVSPTLTSYPSITGFHSVLHCASYSARLKTSRCFRLSCDTCLAVTAMVCSPSPSSTNPHVSGRMIGETHGIW